MPGRIYNRLAEMAVDQLGYVTTADAAKEGINPHRLPEMAKRGVIEHAGHGIYRFPVTNPTGLEEYFLATLWPQGRGVLDGETALDLHDLCDVNPAKISLTVPAEYRIRRQIPAVYRIHHRDLAPKEQTRHEGIPIVTPKRAILDGLERHVRPDLLAQALNTAQQRGLVRGPDLKELTAQIKPRDRS